MDRDRARLERATLLALSKGARRSFLDPFGIIETSGGLPTEPDLDRGRALLEETYRAGARLIIPEDDEWPTDAFNGLDDPPFALWAHGPLKLNQAAANGVAIVGARSSTAYGERVATDMAYGLTELGYVIVSGGAYGIDTAAHRGALVADDGRTVAVLPCGVDVAYPKAHADLFDRIAGTGLLVSEYRPGATPQRERFLARNRLIAALSAGTVVVEASERSGSLNTASRAYGLGRVLMAVPGPVASAMSAGPHLLIRNGAELVTNAGDVATVLSDPPTV